MANDEITLPESYVYVNIANDGDGTSFRCNLSSSQEWHDWLKKFESSACQKFIVKRTRKIVFRYAFGQDLVCQHSRRNKSASADGVPTSRSTDCKASISVKIKHVNKNTRRNDSFLKQSPLAVMTDDSAAMKAALRAVWPSTRQLLCHFHVAQSEWRWLTAKGNNIPDKERQGLMRTFQKVMYATSIEDLETAKEELNGAADDQESESPCPNVRYKERVKKFLQRGDEWLLIRREDVLTRGSNTNNFSEATMRILKDIILSRTKAFNVVALVDFCSTILQNYFVKRLLNFAHGRRANPRLKYSQLCEKMRDVDSDRITVIDQFRYHVPSQRSTNIMYSVDAEFGLCACRSGMNGVFCKHQALVHEKFNVPFPNAPAVTALDRYSLAQLALGDKCPKIDFFASCSDTSALQLDESTATDSNVPASSFNANNLILEDVSTIDDSVQVMSVKESAKQELSRIALLITSYSSSAVSVLLPYLQSIKTEEHLVQAVYHCRSAMKARRGGMIKVQPTSTARRRVGLTRGSKRAASGRPPLNGGIGLQRPCKRARLLAANVERNVPHSKSHGVGH